MKLKNLFYITTIIFLTLSACVEKENSKELYSGIDIRLSGDTSSIELYNIPLNVMEELRTDSIGNEQWKDLFGVYEEPNDPEMRDFQPALDGTYSIMDSLVEFVPSIKFAKGRSYFSRFYVKDIIEGAEDIISQRDVTPANEFLELKFKIN